MRTEERIPIISHLVCMANHNWHIFEIRSPSVQRRVHSFNTSDTWTTAIIDNFGFDSRLSHGAGQGLDPVGQELNQILLC